jgi:hypothetical protein
MRTQLTGEAESVARSCLVAKGRVILGLTYALPSVHPTRIAALFCDRLTVTGFGAT